MPVKNKKSKEPQVRVRGGSFDLPGEDDNGNRLARQTRDPLPSTRHTRDIIQLTKSNYDTWTSHVGDFLYEIQAEGLFKKSELINGAEQTGNCTEVEVTNTSRRLAW